MSWLAYLAQYPPWVLIAEVMLVGCAVVLLVLFSPSRDPKAKSNVSTVSETAARHAVWRPFLNGRCTIIVGTYYDEQIQFWEATGLIGTSSALALGRILGTLNSLGATDCSVLPSANFPGDRLQDNLVLIGGPDANEITRKAVEKIPTRLRFGDPDQHVISITDTADGNVYSPKRAPTGDLIDDYGIALKARSPFNPNSYVIIVAGSFGHGTHVAGQLLDSEALISEATRRVGVESFEILLRTEIVNGWPQAPKALREYAL